MSPSRYIFVFNQNCFKTAKREKRFSDESVFSGNSDGALLLLSPSCYERGTIFFSNYFAPDMLRATKVAAG
jgi:hypothetical protein